MYPAKSIGKAAFNASLRFECPCLKTLSDILESEHDLFVHLGLESEQLEEQDIADCIKTLDNWGKYPSIAG